MQIIFKEAHYDVTLENGEMIKFTLTFKKFKVDKELLSLEPDSTIFYHDGVNWDYISSEKEAEDFYRNGTVNIFVNGNGIFTHPGNEYLNVLNIEPVIQNGVEKSYLTIDFHGVAKQFYDPHGTTNPVYELTNGRFQGVIE